MNRVLPCMSATTPLTDMRMDECAPSLRDREKKLFYAPDQPMLFSFGDDLLTAADRRELIALFSVTKARSEPLSLCDRLTPSLFSSGLISGITPTSVRERLGAAIPDFVLRLPGGGSVEQHAAGCTFSK